MPGNRAEKFVAKLCRQTFLALGSYPNPKGKGGKELCDLLVVCDPDIIIFSVKEVKLGHTGDPLVEMERWQRKAIEASARQIYGCERWLTNATSFVQRDGNPGIALPDPAYRRFYRIAVAIGGGGALPLYMGDFGKGFIHVLTEETFETVLGELDTITDLTAYLRAVSDLQPKATRTVVNGSELDLLAMYLSQGRTFPAKDYDLLLVDGGIWGQFSKNPSYHAKHIADRESYSWDGLINILAEDALHGRMEHGVTLNQTEQAIRQMAREDRFSRRVLGRAFMEFMNEAQEKKVRSRMMIAPSGVTYVFLATPHGTDRTFRKAELGNRCFVARGLNKNSHLVIGIATEQYLEGKGYSLDVLNLFIPEWTPEHEAKFRDMQREFKYFVNPRMREMMEDEYPINPTSPQHSAKKN